MKKLDTAGVLVYTGLAGLIGGLVLNLVVVILWCLFTGGSPYGPVPAAAAETVAMSEELELHHWIVYKADAVQNDMEVAYHLKEALALATVPEHHSLLDRLLEAHHSGGDTNHISDTIEEVMHSARNSEPEEPLELLHASLVHLLLEKGNITEARTQTEHLIALATGTLREHGQEILEAQTKGDIETAKRLVAELIDEQHPPAAAPTPAPAATSTPAPHMMGGMTMPAATPAPDMMGGTPAPTATPAPDMMGGMTMPAATPAGTPTPTPYGGIVFGTFETATVSIQNMAYQPDLVEIMDGGITVTWVNTDSVPHTVTGLEFDSGPLAPGATFSKTFTPAIVNYWCTIHPTMKGTVDVMTH